MHGIFIRTDPNSNGTVAARDQEMVADGMVAGQQNQHRQQLEPQTSPIHDYNNDDTQGRQTVAQAAATAEITAATAETTATTPRP